MILQAAPRLNRRHATRTSARSRVRTRVPTIPRLPRNESRWRRTSRCSIHVRLLCASDAPLPVQENRSDSPNPRYRPRTRVGWRRRTAGSTNCGCHGAVRRPHRCPAAAHRLRVAAPRVPRYHRSAAMIRPGSQPAVRRTRHCRGGAGHLAGVRIRTIHRPSANAHRPGTGPPTSIRCGSPDSTRPTSRDRNTCRNPPAWSLSP